MEDKDRSEIVNNSLWRRLNDSGEIRPAECMWCGTDDPLFNIDPHSNILVCRHCLEREECEEEGGHND